MKAQELAASARTALGFAWIVLLVGCRAQSASDLTSFGAEARARAGGAAGRVRAGSGATNAGSGGRAGGVSRSGGGAGGSAADGGGGEEAPRAGVGGALAGSSGEAGGGDQDAPPAAGAAGSVQAGAAAGAAGAAGSQQAGRAAAAGAAGALASAGGTGDASGWRLVWSDEFEGPSGTPVDSTKWNLVDKGDGFGNNELQFYTPRTDNAALDGQGSLIITARKEQYNGREYTSARLESRGKFEQRYGRFEARLQVPRGQGLWPAFWMLGSDIERVSWPACGEIDIMEHVGKEPSVVHGSLHGPGYSAGDALTASRTLPGGRAFADAFHTFAVEWEENEIRFYLDGELYETRTPADVPQGSRWVYDHPFFLLLNLAVGGQWPGSPDATTTFPQQLAVDYVRVYAR